MGIAILMIVELMVMAVLGLTRYEMRRGLKIKQMFNDRFFVFMSVVLSMILMAMLFFQSDAIMQWFEMRGESNSLIGAWFCLMIIPFFFGAVLYCVGKYTSLVYKRHLVEKRTWLRELKKTNDK